MDWDTEKRAMQREMLKKHREISTLKRSAGRAHDQMIAAQARAHDAKIRAKSAEGSLRALQDDALRFRWCLNNRAEAAALFKMPETFTPDEMRTLLDCQRLG